MSLSDLTLDQILSGPLFAVQALAESLVLNIGAERWLWAQIALALALILGLAADLWHRRDLRKRYLSRNFRVNVNYALVYLFQL
jgi:hypothetical protein